MNTFGYSLFGFNIQSELELSDLPDANGQPDIFIRYGRIAPEKYRTTIQSEFAFTAGVGRFHVMNGSEVIADLLPDADPLSVRAILFGRVMAFVVRQRGWLPLHASGVFVDGKAVLFLAPSGGGKSTTAAAFYAAGHRVVTDDLAPLRPANGTGVQLRTSALPLRLLEDAATLLQVRDLHPQLQADKHCFHLSDRTVPKCIPLACIYVLSYAEHLRCETLEPLRAATLLSENTVFSRRRAETAVIQAHVDLCTRISSVAPIRYLIRPRALDKLPALINLVEAELRSIG